jgi:hypothetical protein
MKIASTCCERCWSVQKGQPTKTVCLCSIFTSHPTIRMCHHMHSINRSRERCIRTCIRREKFAVGDEDVDVKLFSCFPSFFLLVSLLGTWDGEGVELWNPRRSNMLQVLLSIQGLLLGKEKEEGENEVTLPP